jgi:hypothetical protein
MPRIVLYLGSIAAIGLILSVAIAVVGFVQLQDVATQRQYLDEGAANLAKEEQSLDEAKAGLAKEQQFLDEGKAGLAREEATNAQVAKEQAAEQERLSAEQSDLTVKEEQFTEIVKKQLLTRDEDLKQLKAKDAERDQLILHIEDLEGKLREDTALVSHLQAQVDKLMAEKKESDLTQQTRTVFDAYRKIANRTEQLANDKHDQKLLDLLTSIGFPLDDQSPARPATGSVSPTHAPFHYSFEEINRKMGGLLGGLISLAPTDENAAQIVTEFSIKQTSPTPTTITIPSVNIPTLTPAPSLNPGPSATPAPSPTPGPQVTPVPSATPVRTPTPVPTAGPAPVLTTWAVPIRVPAT